MLKLLLKQDCIREHKYISMDFNRNNKQLTVGDLKKLLDKVPNNVNLYVGYGCDVKPLKFLDRYDEGIMFHPDIYGETACILNILTVESFK